MHINIENTKPFQNEYKTNLPEKKSSEHQHILCLDTKTGTVHATERYGLIPWLKRVFSIFT